MKRSLHLLLLPLLALLVVACEETPTSGNDDPIAPGLKMTVNGDVWTASSVSTNPPLAPVGNQVFEILAYAGLVGQSESVLIFLVSFDEGSYDIDAGNDNASVIYIADSDPGSSFASDQMTAQSGNLTITESTPDSLVGRFDFRGTTQSGTIVTVTGGEFRVAR